MKMIFVAKIYFALKWFFLPKTIVELQHKNCNPNPNQTLAENEEKKKKEKCQEMLFDLVVNGYLKFSNSQYISK